MSFIEIIENTTDKPILINSQSIVSIREGEDSNNQLITKITLCNGSIIHAKNNYDYFKTMILPYCIFTISEEDINERGI